MWDTSVDPIANLPLDRSERALSLRNGLISQATGSSIESNVYRLLRSEILSDPATAKLAPKFLRTCNDASDFWEFIKIEFSTYRERREYLRTQFEALIAYLESSGVVANGYISEALEKFDTESVGAAWAKAIGRSVEDPEGAITAARTLLETVCKHILDDDAAVDTSYGPNDDLPKLYHLVSLQLGIAPSQHTENIFKQILGGCNAVVTGLGALRNKAGDAHGQGRKAVRVQTRHAALAVNLAGAMSSFLVETHSARQASSQT